MRLGIGDYRQAAARAKAAGFDGVELHAANGYLPDQFLQDGSNHRTVAYGGSIANRSRFLLEVVEAMVSVWGSGRVAVRIGPSGTWNGMTDSDPRALFAYVADQLNRVDLAYLHIIEPRVKGNILIAEGQAPVAAQELRTIFKAQDHRCRRLRAGYGRGSSGEGRRRSRNIRTLLCLQPRSAQTHRTGSAPHSV